MSFAIQKKQSAEIEWSHKMFWASFSSRIQSIFRLFMRFSYRFKFHSRHAHAHAFRKISYNQVLSNGQITMKKPFAEYNENLTRKTRATEKCFFFFLKLKWSRTNSSTRVNFSLNFFLFFYQFTFVDVIETNMVLYARTMRWWRNARILI